MKPAMKSLSRLSMALRIAGVAGLMLTGGAAYAGEAQACPATLQHTFDRLQDEKPQSLCQYSGKVVLIVNTASYCGFTGQYKGLEDLYARYKDKGLVVLGFPSNDFSQESGSNQQIADFCENTFGVKFPMFAKSSVKGPEASPLYRQLAQLSGTAQAVTNPADRREQVGSWQAADAATVERALVNAVTAQPAWDALPATSRAKLLDHAADLLQKRLPQYVA